ncbi:MAG: DEAD/DEAH box helicase [Gaiellaceae bacterium MAG52_C11]|nr:DEAD/DEAH box helicase [Candidatus Gaiellasilicea maunaloa]
MSRPEHTPPADPDPAILEILWQQDATACVFARSDGGVSAHGLHVGMPSTVELPVAGGEVAVRRIDPRELVRLAESPPRSLEVGDTARALFALVELARRSVAEGLVHPHLDHGDGWWYAFWGATLDESVKEALSRIAAALPAVATSAFGGDAEATVDDLYPILVDQIARDRLRASGVRLASPARQRPGALELFLAGLAADEPVLPRHSGYSPLERHLSRWVDDGLGRLSAAPWRLGLRLTERLSERDSPSDTSFRDTSKGLSLGPVLSGHDPGIVPPDGVPAGGPPALVLELWLHAEDDPTLALPAALIWNGEDGVFTFLRASDPRRDLIRRLAEIEPLLAAAGIELDAAEPDELELDPDVAAAFLRETMPRLEERGVPVLLPAAWLRAPSRLRVDLTATSRPAGRASGLLSPAALARFDWRLAVGDVALTDEELAELAAAKERFVRIAGRWHALRQTDVERALLFLERRRNEAGIVDLVRAVSGLETDEAGLELGRVTLDTPLAELLGLAEPLGGVDLVGGERRFRSLPTPAGMRFDLFPFQERGHGWLRLLGDLGVGGILADDMGLGKTVQAIAMLVSEREEAAPDELGPTLVVCPMSVVRQWGAEIDRFAPSLRVHLHHGVGRLAGSALAAKAPACDVVVTSYDIATRDADALALVAWDRLLLDEAQDVKNPATKRARTLRRLPARRKLAMTGTPIENRLGELWAIMDIVNPGLLGSREWFERTFARPIELAGDAAALERLRSIVEPFALRREKDAPEVELELPPITIAKDYCRLTVEQASLYQATVDRWLPRIEEHAESFGRRGAVLAMLSQLKQVCNHPEALLATGRPLDGRSGKLERLLELLEQVPAGDKALVFTQYPGFDRLVPHLEERLGRDVGFFHGRLNARQREALLTAFAAGDGPSVLVVSIKAGGRGLNLPAANHVFHFDRWWNPAVEQQATDRVHRFGQRKHVFVHSLICTGTLEERIDQLLDSKRELAEKVIAGRSDDWLGNLDLGAIRAAVALAPDSLEDAA